MQPHAMCSLAIANWAWNSGANENWRKIPKSCKAVIEFVNENGGYRKMYYDLDDIECNEKTLKVRIMKSSGDLSCTVTAERTGDKVVMNHGTQHAVNVYEEFKMSDTSIYQGNCVNSRRYAGFSGEVKKNYLTHLVMGIEIRLKTGGTKKIQYTIDLTGLPK